MSLRPGKGDLASPFRVLLLVVLLLAGVAQAAAGEDASTRGAVYRRPIGNEPATLDPALISDVYGRSVAQQIFDGLVSFDQTLAITPALAKFWTASRDGLTWTFRLRRHVRFHHGREMTASDVVYSLTRILDPRVKSPVADLFTGIHGAREFREGRAPGVAGLTAPDRYTVHVVLDESQVPFVSLLAVGGAKIVPRELVEAPGGAFGRHPVGTGPFRFVDWQRGKEIVLAANPGYFGGAPRLGRVVYRIFSGEQYEPMYQAFERGDLEDSPVPDRNYRQIVTSPAHVYVRRPMLSLRFYGFNVRTRPLNDPRVRQAVIAAVNREGILEEISLGRYTPARGILPPGTQGYNPKLRAIPYDPQHARELLAQAGYPGGRGLPPLAIWSSVKHEAAVREFDRVRTALAAVGIQSSMNYQTDWPTYSRMLAEGRLPVFVYAWYADVPDPDNFLFKLFYSKSPRNLFGYANPAVDDLLVRARGEADMQRRVALYRAAEQLILEDAPLMPVMHHTYERLFQRYVKSVEVNGLGDPYIPLRKVWLQRPGGAR